MTFNENLPATRLASNLIEGGKVHVTQCQYRHVRH